MTDRELLEAAAKAAGYGVDGYVPTYRDGEGWVCIRPPDDACPFQVVWAPLTDDGDALRLAVRLHLDVNQFPVTESEGIESCMGMVEVWRNGDSDPTSVELLQPGDDRYAATRRAIVRAAAAMVGK